MRYFGSLQKVYDLIYEKSKITSLLTAIRNCSQLPVNNIDNNASMIGYQWKIRWSIPLMINILWKWSAILDGQSRELRKSISYHLSNKVHSNIAPVPCTRPNEEWSGCPSDCLQERCEDIHNQPTACNTFLLNCQPKCICKKDHFRNATDICVPVKECRKLDLIFFTDIVIQFVSVKLFAVIEVF